MKLLFLGVDGTSYRVMKRLKEREDIAFLSDVGFQDNMLISLNTGKAEPHTGPSWSTIYTGVTSDEHGIKSGGWLNQHDGYSNLKVKTIWEMLDEKSIPIGLFCLPLTHPAPKLKHGWSVSGFPRPREDSKNFHPENLPEYVKKTEPSILSGEEGGLLKKIFDKEKVLRIEEEKIKNFVRITEEREIELGAIGVMAIDHSNHLLPQKKSNLLSGAYDVIRLEPTHLLVNAYTTIIQRLDGNEELEEELFGVYTKIFKMLDKLVDETEPENIILCSDHGFFKYGCEKHLPKHDIFGYVGAKGEITSFMKKRMDITDIGPMILKLFEIDESIGQKITRKAHSYSKKEEEEIKNRLKTLGYLE